MRVRGPMKRRTLGLASAVGLAYGLHRIGRRWNVSNRELAGDLPGDELVPAPMWESTRGITIAAPIAEVWPWIVQMGFPAHRAGWYTPYLLDRLTFGIRQHSAAEVRPELQNLKVGDRIPDSLDWSVYFTVSRVDPPYSLVLHSTRHIIKPIRTTDFSWAFVLRELSAERTRLLIRARTSFTPPWARLFAEFVIGPADFVNVLGMLHGIRCRSERTHAASTGRPMSTTGARPGQSPVEMGGSS